MVIESGGIYELQGLHQGEYCWETHYAEEATRVSGRCCDSGGGLGGICARRYQR